MTQDHYFGHGRLAYVRIPALLAVLVALLIPRPALGQAGFLHPRKVADSLLMQLISDPTVRTVDTDAVGGPGSAYLVLRMYAQPIDGDCVPGKRTVCSHHYFMSVGGNDSLNEAALYDMGEFGEIEWVELLDPPDAPATARIRLRVLTYPRSATPLARGKSLYQVVVVARVSADAFELGG